jgi:hypothetical protein
MVIFGRTSALLLAMVLLPCIYLNRQGVRVPDVHAWREIARAELVAEAGFEPATQRL